VNHPLRQDLVNGNKRFQRLFRKSRRCLVLGAIPPVHAGTIADDNSANHPGVLVWNTVVVVYARLVQRDRKALIWQKKVRIPRLGAPWNAARTPPAVGMVGRGGVRIAEVAVSPANRLPRADKKPNGIEPDIGAVGAASHIEIDEV